PALTWRLSIYAAQPEQRRRFGDITDVHETVHGVRGDVVTSGRGRNGEAEDTGERGDVADVGDGVAIDIGGPGVGAAVDEGAGAGRVLDGGAEAVAVGVISGDGPRWQGLRGIRPVGAVVRGVEDAVAVQVARAGSAGQAEEGGHPRDIGDVDEAIRRIRGDVVTGGRGRDRESE